MPALRGLTWQAVRGHAPLVATARAYRRIHPDVTVEWEQLPWEEFRATSHAEMGRHSGRYDLYMFDHPWVGEYATRGWLVPLEPLLTADQAADLASDADPASYRSYRHGGHLYGLPVDAACHVINFRPDLLGTAAVPTDWDSLLDLARRVHRPRARYAFLHSWAGSAHAGNCTLSFIALLHAAGVRPFADRDHLTIDPRVGQRCLDVMRQIWDLSVPLERVPEGGYRHLLERDDVAMTVSLFAYITYFGATGPRRLVVADVPALPETGVKTSIIGGMGLGISVDSAHRDLAWDYAWFVMSREVQGGLYLDNEGQPGRVSALSNPTADARRAGFCTVLRKALVDAYVRPTYPGWMLVENGANPAVHHYLTGRCTAAEVFAAFERQARRAWGQE
jgi:multiple sugar transport system substrate-binding protein